MSSSQQAVEGGGDVIAADNYCSCLETDDEMNVTSGGSNVGTTIQLPASTMASSTASVGGSSSMTAETNVL